MSKDNPKHVSSSPYCVKDNEVRLSYFDDNVLLIKKIGPTYRIVYLPFINRGSDVYQVDGVLPDLKMQKQYDYKLESSISRTRKVLYEYSMCNDFDYFCTFTIDKNKFNRYDLKSFYDTFSKTIRNFSFRNNLDLRYIFVPELHSDGAIHLHGIVGGLPLSFLHAFTLADQPLPYYILDKINNNEPCYSFPFFSSKFGYTLLEPIRSRLGVSRYLLKYVTKDLLNCVTEKNKRVYYCSKGLKRAELVADIDVYSELGFEFKKYIDSHFVGFEFCSILDVDEDKFFPSDLIKYLI